MRESDYYPAGAYLDPSAPYNQVDVPTKDFEVTCSQSLSRTATVWTSNYIPGASGVDYEPDDEGGTCACGWQDPDDTSDTNWSKEYSDCGYKTPLELIGLLKEYLLNDLAEWKTLDEETPHAGPAFHVRRLEHLIEECDCWTEDETEIIGE